MTVTVDDAVPVGETDALILVESVADADAVTVSVLEAETATRWRKLFNYA